MKKIITTALGLCLTMAALAQGAQQFDTTYQVVTVVTPQSFYLDSRLVSNINGRSRMVVPVQLPPKTVKWVLSFGATESKNEPMEWVGLAAQLTRIVDATGISAAVINQVVKPGGTALCDIYVLESSQTAAFEQKEDDKWRFDKNLSKQNLTSGLVEGTAAQPQFAIGLLNPSIKTGVNVKVEVSAIVAHLKPVYNTARAKNAPNPQHLWLATDRDVFFKEVEASFEGKTDEKVKEMCFCTVQKLVQNFRPNEFSDYAPDEQSILLGRMKHDCFTETKNEALGMEMGMVYRDKQEIERLANGGEWVEAAALAKKVATQYPSFNNRLRYVQLAINAQKATDVLYLAETLVGEQRSLWSAQLAVAAAYLFTNQSEKAEKAYLLFKQTQNDAGTTWEQEVSGAFRFFAQIGLTHPDMAKIKKKLKIRD